MILYRIRICQDMNMAEIGKLIATQAERKLHSCRTDQYRNLRPGVYTMKMKLFTLPEIKYPPDKPFLFRN
mgnify:CR=1 FL=1